MKNKIYLCKYSNGSYDDYFQTTVFATKNLKTAENWVNKFNKKLEYWKEYYNQFTDNKWGFDNIADRYWKVMECDKAFIKEINLRK